MDPKGKIVVVTGATSGLGQAVAIDIAKQGAKVFIVGRDADRANQTLSQAKGGGGNAEVILGDVSTRAGAKAVAQQILQRTNKVDVLLNNAGGNFKTMSKTSDGIETTFALNTLGAWILEKELHPALAAAKGRVVNVATGFLDGFPVNPEDLVEPKQFKTLRIYGVAKQASVMMTVEQAKRFAGDGVTVVSMHPGIIMGTRFGGGTPKIAQMIGGPIMRAMGIACTMEEAVRRFNVACFGDVPSGSYLQKGAVSELPKPSKDEGVRQQVVALLEKLTAEGVSGARA
jgi:NAD(P)-dependent dehydrogenase (short-subunit alcohol dehydrogenase family)